MTNWIQYYLSAGSSRVVSRFINIEAEIERMLRYSGAPRLDNGIAIDVERLVRETFDIDVAYIDGLKIRGRPIAGALIPEHKILLVEASDIKERQRFTIAHECGHLILDYRNVGSPSLFVETFSALFSCSVMDIDDGATPWRKRREVLANQFAARLLMPARLCKEVFHNERTVEHCAFALNVSKEACRIRLAELGFVQNPQM